jgi:hypothetical protein
MALLKLFSALSIVFGLISALLWVISATVTVKANGEPPHGGWGGGTVQDGSGNDVVKTLGKQSLWNARAAICAALSVLFQILSLYISN